MAVYTIRELENLSGIKAHTIRIWEKRYNLIMPDRTSTNIRTYCDSELKKLLNISILNRNGLKISKIAQLSSQEIVEKVHEVSQDANHSENQVEGLVLAMIDMDEIRFEQVLSRSIIQYGFEETVTRVLYPFFVRVGLMWQTGLIFPAQEHFISNLVRQKFFTAIDGLIGNERPDAGHYLFFLPEGEWHEIGLLFYCYLTKKRGHHVIYLGQSVPLNDIEEIVRVRRIGNLVTTLMTSYLGYGLDEYARLLAEKFQACQVYIFGAQVAAMAKAYPNITPVINPDKYLAEISTRSPVTVP